MVVVALLVEVVYAQMNSLETACLACHQEQKIPSAMVYKRYLMRYSTPQKIENAMVAYLKHPSKKASIMPPQFFLKFPMKDALQMEEPQIRQWVQAYMQRYDLKKRLRLAPQAIH